MIGAVWRRLPAYFRLHLYKRATAPMWRPHRVIGARMGRTMTPSFLIIGAQKSGTTALFNRLQQHPQIVSPLKKEVHFFDDNFERGMDWYLSHFPLVNDADLITGEGSPFYLFSPDVPARVRDVLPSVKLIAILRNPVERAISHYWHERRYRFESASFEVAIEREMTMLKSGEWDLSDRSVEFAERHYTYLSRGLYVDQIGRWSDLFQFDQLKIIRHETFLERPQAVLASLCDYLNVDAFDFDLGASNSTKHPVVSPELLKMLTAFFEPHNARLGELLNESFDDWTIG